MASFAELDENNVVIRVVKISNKEILDADGNESEALGTQRCVELFGGGIWKQTSYTRQFRGVYAAKEYTYDANQDLFLPPKPFPSWVFNVVDGVYEPPSPKPEGGVDENGEYVYRWEEKSLSWVKFYI